MVSNVRLAQIHSRLHEIFRKHHNIVKSFGGQNLIFFGDLLQVIFIFNFFINYFLIFKSILIY